MWPDVTNVTWCDQLDHFWLTNVSVTNVTRCYKCYNTKISLTIRPHVATCDHVICDQMLPMLPYVTKPIWPFGSCDHMSHLLFRTRWYQIWWLHLIPHQLLWLPTPVTLVTHSSYSGYSVQLLQLPISVIPVTHSSYSGYPLQLLWLPTPVTPVTNSSYSGYPLQSLKLLWLPIPVPPKLPPQVY